MIKLRRLKWAEDAASMRERRGAYRGLEETPEERRPLGTLRRKWEYNIKMDLTEGRWGHGLDRLGLG
jgi:hypothetical protein